MVCRRARLPTWPSTPIGSGGAKGSGSRRSAAADRARQVDLAITEQQLQPGDTIAYYSDGISEARSPAGEQFGLERLKELLVHAAASQLTPAETARRTLREVVQHHNNALEDDATLLLATWHASGTN